MHTQETETSSEEKTLPPSASTSCDEMAVLKPWSEVTRLGQLILTELKQAETNKTLTRWIAHRIAELMERGESTDAQQTREEARRECTDLIIRLWQSRQQWPDRVPLSKLVSLLVKAIPPEPSRGNPPPKEPSTWIEAIAPLDQLQAEEMFLCWQAACLDIDEAELEAELARSEAFTDALDDEERSTIAILRSIRDENRSLQQLTHEERTEYYVKKLAEIHEQRAALFVRVRGTVASLSSLLGQDDIGDHEQ